MFKNYYNSALKNYRNNSFDTALDEINQSLLLQPTNYSALHLKALILKKQNKLRESSSTYQLAIENCNDINKKEKLIKIKEKIDSLFLHLEIEDLIDFDHDKQFIENKGKTPTLQDCEPYNDKDLEVHYINVSDSIQDKKKYDDKTEVNQSICPNNSTDLGLGAKIIGGVAGIIGVGIGLIFLIVIFGGIYVAINYIPAAVEEKITGKEVNVLPKNVYSTVLRAERLYNSGKYSDALLEYKNAHDMYESSSSPLIGMGLCYNKLGDSQNELEAYKKAIAVDPGSKTAWYNAGNVFFNHEDYETAISFYDKAIQIDEGFKDAWYNKAAALKNLGQDFEAQYAIAKAAR